MLIKRILCPIDFSEFNHSANEFASSLALANGSRIIYLHVAIDHLPQDGADLNIENETKRLVTELEKVQPTVGGIQASYVVEWGFPSDRIAEYANENDIDIVVIGTHGHTGLKRVLMGSVAESVIRKSDCPVLAVKAGSKVLQSN